MSVPRITGIVADIDGMPLAPQNSWWQRWTQAIVEGNDRQRAWYTRWRELRCRRAIHKRRAALRDLENHSMLNIEPRLGFKKFDTQTLCHSQAVAAFARDQLKAYDPKQRSQRWNETKGLYGDWFDVQQLTLESSLVQFAIDESLIAAVAQYLGCVPVLARIDLWYSEFVQQLNRTHLYHCDWTATEQVKVFVFCNEVTTNSGPLMVVEREYSQRIRDELDYNYDLRGKRYHVGDVDMVRLGAHDHTHAMTGTSGSGCLVDTSRCFHYGSRLAPGFESRLVALFQYLRPGAFRLPIDFQNGAPHRHLATKQLSYRQRLVLGAE